MKQNQFFWRRHLLFFGLIVLSLLPTRLLAQITLVADGKSVKEVIKDIESQTTYRFFYKEDLAGLDKTVIVSANNENLSDVLKMVLAGTGLDFRQEANNIVVIYAANGAVTQTVSGVVVDEKGEAVIGANVMVKGSTTGTITDFNGHFSLQAAGNDWLTVSYIGYQTQVVKVNAQNRLRIVLKEDSKALEEVVVIGYGTMSKKLLTTSISKLDMGETIRGNDTDPMKIMQGRVTGVSVSSASGTPGASPNVVVRGVGSVSGNSAPLYVVDGIPTETYPKLNPNDIESIEVLKDASAAAIYGSRASNGVILMTTKSGKTGKTKIDASYQAGFGSVASDITMANSTQYINVMQTAVDNYNVQMRANEKLYVPDEIEETDWVNEITRDVAFSQQASVSVSGGNDKTRFYTSYGYNGQEGYIKTSGYSQHTLRAKFSHSITDWLKLNMNLSGAASRQDKVEESSTSLKVLRAAREEQPWYSPYMSDGSYKVITESGLCRHNPIMLINEETWYVKKYSGSGVFSFDLTPFKGFKYTPSLSLYSVFDDGWRKLSDKHNARRYNSGWYALTQQKDVSFRYVIDNLFSYTNEWKKLNYSAMLGHSFEKYVYETFGAASENYADGAYPSASLNAINVGASIYPADIDYTGYALESYFGRVALNWDNRYVLNASLRCDGSSRFSEDHRYGWFPAASLAWLTSNEHFYNTESALNSLKFRLSYGMTGSQNGIGNFAALSLVQASGSSYNGVGGFSIYQDAQDLRWEKTTTYNFGADFELFKSRMDMTLDVFYSLTNDLLYDQPIYSTTGYTSIASNIGSLDNKGVEFAINGKIFDGDFKWSVGANISYVKNRLISLVDGTESIVLASAGTNVGGVVHILQNGQPVGSWYMLKMLGLYQYDEDVPEKLYAKGVRAGDVMYEDINGDGDISDDDRQIVGKATPDFTGGINTSLSYKGFDLYILGQYSVGAQVYAAWKGAYGGEGTEHLGYAYSSVTLPGTTTTAIQFYNVSEYAATHYWSGPGTSNSVPRPVMKGVHTGYSTDYNILSSTRYLEKASFFRLKTISLGYSLPQKVLSYIHASACRVYVSADNLFTITKYDGYDPEVSYNNSPGNKAYGVDFGLQPTLRTFMVGATLSF